MTRIIAVAISAFDPRGRTGRAGLLVMALALLVLEMAAAALVLTLDLPLTGPLALGLKAAFFWIATAALSKRLHDLGKSAWLIAKGASGVVLWSAAVSIVLMVVLGTAAMEPGQAGYMISVAATTAPVLLAILWLHCAPGMPGPNRFGPPPQGWLTSATSGHAPAPAAAMSA